MEFLQGLEEDTGETPPALLNRPILDPEVDAFLDAFFALSPSRQQGMAPGGIPIVEMRAYCEMFHVEHVELFIDMMRSLDHEFLAFQAERIKRGA